MPLSQEQIQYQLDHKNEDRASDIIVTHVVCLSLAVVFVALRFISRRLKAGLGIDDWVMLLALVGDRDAMLQSMLCTLK